MPGIQNLCDKAASRTREPWQVHTKVWEEAWREKVIGKDPHRHHLQAQRAESLF